MNDTRTNLDNVWDKNFKSYFSVDQIPEISYTYGPYPPPACEVDNLPLPPMRLDPYAAAKQAIMNNPAISDAAKAVALAALNNAQKYAGTGPVLPPPPPVINPNRPSGGGGGPITYPEGNGGYNPTGGGNIGIVVTIDDNGTSVSLFFDPYQTADQLAQQLRLLLTPPAPVCGTGGTADPGDPTPPTPGLPDPNNPPPGGNPDTPPRIPPNGGGYNPGGGGGGRNPFNRGNGIGPVNLP